jgi:valyl-tRNA synthetase
MKEPLAKAYEPKAFEDKWYSYWNDNGLFRAEVRPGKPRFSLVIPPPNVTGSLHIGHALDETLQDILVRYARMRGLETLWLPGTDHASIATHAKIEEMLANEGASRWELGRRSSWSGRGRGKRSTATSSTTRSGSSVHRATGPRAVHNG